MKFVFTAIWSTKLCKNNFSLICAQYRCKNKCLRDICVYSDIKHKAVIARFVLHIAVKTIFRNNAVSFIVRDVVW